MIVFKTIEECGLEFIGEPANDWLPVSAARASFGKQDKTGKDVAADRKLMVYLAKHKHTSCFEHQHATFLIEVPLFIRSQIHRHRTFSYNEISRRYTEENLAFWKPTTWRAQASSNRQASEGDVSYPDLCSREYTISTYTALEDYEFLVKQGVCREQARAVLPQSLLTQFYMTGNLRNWQHFIKLRTDEHAQKEVQVVANRISEQLGKLYPESWKAMMEYM